MSAKAHVGIEALGCPVEWSSTRFSRRALQNLGALCSKGSSSGGKLPILVATLALLATAAWGQGMSKDIVSPPANVRPPYLENVGIEQHMNAQVPPDLTFVDDTGRTVKLGDYFGKKPLILNL